jgi:hypothetical protein
MKKIYLVVILSTSLLLAACNSGAPDCGDSDVKELVSETFKEQFANFRIMYVMSGIAERNSKIDAPGSDSEKDSLEIQKIIIKNLPIGGGYGNYQDYVAIKDENKVAYQIVDAIEKELKDIDFDDIRTNSKDDKIKKSECVMAANMVVNGKSSSMELPYTAQINDEEEISVKVKNRFR